MASIIMICTVNCPFVTALIFPLAVYYQGWREGGDQGWREGGGDQDDGLIHGAESLGEASPDCKVLSVIKETKGQLTVQIMMMDAMQPES